MNSFCFFNYEKENSGWSFSLIGYETKKKPHNKRYGILGFFKPSERYCSEDLRFFVHEELFVIDGIFLRAHYED